MNKSERGELRSLHREVQDEPMWYNTTAGRGLILDYLRELDKGLPNLLDQLDRYEAALAFYADDTSWGVQLQKGYSRISDDGGHTARTALQADHTVGKESE